MPSWTDIQAFLDAYPHLAYLALFIGTFLEGETILIIAGFAAQDGRPNIYLVMLSAFAGSLAGDQTWFFVGRLKGKAFLATRPAWLKRAEKVFDILHRHQNWLMLGFRFLYGLRNVTPFALGMSEVKTRKFVLLNVIGAAVWAVAFAMIGFGFSLAVAKHADHLKLPIFLGFTLLVVVVWVIRVVIRRRNGRTVAANAPLPPPDAQ